MLFSVFQNNTNHVSQQIKPNTPQVLLRRPKVGEMAVSLTGSPLMVNSVLSDVESTVTVPLGDGRTFAIQPQRGLRASQIPQMDSHILMQLETLRDNLNKVCAVHASAKRT